MSGTTPLQHPDRIGPYSVLQVIGEGGMGVVYEAEQKSPVRRRVAVKMMKVGMDTREVVGRFEAERQALAVMDHPGIAKVFDAGVTDEGRPYFVMELVRGVRLDDFCDTNRLTTRQRVELFVAVCEAVQHAHQKGVIHRDLKPSNILVSSDSDRPQPRIIDFGVAKATGQRLSERTVVTTYGQAMGTLAYMSPEQAEMTGLDIDTRSDIYSLGAILYEVVLGVVPLDPQEIGVPAFLAALIERDWTVPTPTKRFTNLAVERREVLARHRGTDESGLRRELDGDLQWIVLKAMEKDRNRRYETANGLAADLRRYLEDQPVVAHPPSTAYRVRKFGRRHRSVVAMAAVMAALSVGYVASIVVQTRRVAEERDRAEAEAETARRVSDFMVELFAVSDPSEARGRSVTALEILERGSERITQELGDDPDIQGRLMYVMGDVYMGLGLYDESEELLLSGLEAARRGSGETDVSVGVSLHNLAWLYRWQNRLSDALPLAQQAAAIYEETIGVEDPLYGRVQQVIGMIERDQGNFDAGRAALEQALATTLASLGPDHPDAGWNHYHIGWLHFLEGDLPAAQAELAEAVRILEAGLPADDPELGSAYDGLATVLTNLGEGEAALDIQQRILDLRERTQGPDHPDVAVTLNAMGVTLNRLGEHERALELQERALAIQEEAYHPDHPFVAGTLNNIGLTLQSLGRYREARDRYAAAIRIHDAADDEDDLERAHARALGNLGYLYRYVGEGEAARPLLRRAVEILEARMGSDHFDLVPSLVNLGFIEGEAGQVDEAVRILQRVLALTERRHGVDSPESAAPLLYLAQAHRANGSLELALDLARRSAALEDRTGGGSVLDDAHWTAAFALAGLGRQDEADSLATGVVERIAARWGEDGPDYAWQRARLAVFEGDFDQGESWLTEVIDRGYRDPRILRDSPLRPLWGSDAHRAAAAIIRDEIDFYGTGR